MKKIRFVNPIRTCKEVQGKAYTAIVIATIVAAVILCGLAAWGGMPICAGIFGIMAVGSTIGFGWWFGTESIPVSAEDWD